jgi:hypothetical protein
MAVIAIFIYDVKPESDCPIMTQLQQAASSQFNGKVCQSVFACGAARFLIPVLWVLMIEYENTSAYGARRAFETSNAA